MQTCQRCTRNAASQQAALAKNWMSLSGIVAVAVDEYTRQSAHDSMVASMWNRVNRKRIQRPMQKPGLAGVAPGPNSSRTHPQHRFISTRCKRSASPPRPGLEYRHHLHEAATWLVDLVTIIDCIAAWYCHGGSRTRWMTVTMIACFAARLARARASLHPQQKGDMERAA